MMASREVNEEQPTSQVRREPFRLFFVLGVLLSWIGVGHWLLYALGITSTYSCEVHGLVQMQGFMIAFALGFLLTALPRRTRSSPPTHAEIAILALSLVWTAAAGVLEERGAAQLGYGLIFLVMARFALPRLAGAGGVAARRPPAAFVLIPIAVTFALLGALAIGAESLDYGPRWAFGFGRLLVEQGVFLCLVIAVGNLLLPLMGGTAPPGDVGSSAAENRRSLVFAAAGIAIFAGLLLEQLGRPTLGTGLRALVVVLGLGRLALRPPNKPGLHRRMTWVSVWMIPLGLIASAIWPDYRVAALHLVFIGGFGTMAFAVGSHVALGHLGMPELGLGRPWPVVAVATTFPLALLARVAADSSDLYFEHLGFAAVWWILGSGLWLSFFVRKMLNGLRTS